MINEAIFRGGRKNYLIHIGEKCILQISRGAKKTIQTP